MIWSFVMSAVLIIVASLGWGFIFSHDFTGVKKSIAISFIAFASIASFFAAFFLGEGIVHAGGVVTLPVSSVIFAGAFAAVMAAGLGLGFYPGTSRLFASAANLLRSEEWNGRDDRAELIEGILDRSVESGEIDSLERELIEGILKFKDKIVREVMIPRGDIVALNIEEEPRKVLRRVIAEGYSRMPVYRESIDNIVGIIYAKDLLTMVEDGAAIVLQDLLRTPYYVPESKKISQLLREMQLNKIHLAVVVDEFGGTEGIVTLEDVLEEIVGEIQDEYDETMAELVRDENGGIHFSGSMTVERFDELLGANIPREEDYDTMAGFVQKLAGKIPQKNEVYTYGEMYFFVEEVAKHRIKRLKVSYKEHPSPPVEPEKESIPSSAEEAVANDVSREAGVLNPASKTVGGKLKRARKSAKGGSAGKKRGRRVSSGGGNVALREAENKKN